MRGAPCPRCKHDAPRDQHGPGSITAVLIGPIVAAWIGGAALVTGDVDPWAPYPLNEVARTGAAPVAERLHPKRCAVRRSTREVPDTRRAAKLCARPDSMNPRGTSGRLNAPDRARSAW